MAGKQKKNPRKSRRFTDLSGDGLRRFRERMERSADQEYRGHRLKKNDLHGWWFISKDGETVARADTLPKARAAVDALLGRRENPRRRAVKLPRADVERAASLYSSFHERPARRIRLVPVRRMPKVAMQLGRLDAVLYAADHGVRYKHSFKGKSRPYLVASPDGRTLAIVGGRFQMTARGIVDK